MVERTMNKDLTITSTGAIPKNPNNVWTIGMEPLNNYYNATVFGNVNDSFGSVNSSINITD